MQTKRQLYCVAFCARSSMPGLGSIINLKHQKSWKLKIKTGKPYRKSNSSIIADALALRAAENTKRTSTIVPLIPPEESSMIPRALLAWFKNTTLNCSRILFC